ncbi:MAG: sialate O-acetylesterase [Opitutaceae bacterium]|jgi:sialate O-acetylesterase|nr:sialate O-acetylesterase [Opitutaceae bacterium]
MARPNRRPSPTITGNSKKSSLPSRNDITVSVTAHNHGILCNHRSVTLIRRHYPGIRQFKVPERSSASPLDPCELAGEWVVCSLPTVGRDFTAVGYFFARDLHRRYNIPQGIIKSVWGGTPVEAWMSAEDPALHSLRAVVQPGSEDRRVSSGAFNAMIRPLIPFTLRGVLWYQGEANARQPDGYGTLFRALVTDWRQRPESPTLPAGRRLENSTVAAGGRQAGASQKPDRLRRGGSGGSGGHEITH